MTNDNSTFQTITIMKKIITPFVVVQKNKFAVCNLKFAICISLLTAGSIAPPTFSFGQNVGINITGNTPDASAGLDIDFGNKGLLIPRVALTSNTDVTTIASPTTSLQVYNTGAGGLSPAGFYFWNGSQWVQFGATGSSGPTGANGATGPTGTQGITGPTGAAGGGCDKAVFNASGSWTVPASVTSIWIELWGGGGGGDQQSADVRSGGGGGYGKDIFTVNPGDVLTITVGTGGAAGASNALPDGATGGTSSVTGPTVAISAIGGGGGAGSSGTDGAGGTSTASINCPGEYGIGNPDIVNNNKAAFIAHGGAAGCGGGQGGTMSPSPSPSPENGYAPGGGGAGCNCGSGNGAAGRVIIWYCQGAVGATGPTGPSGGPVGPTGPTGPAGGAVNCNTAHPNPLLHDGPESGIAVNSNTTGYTEAVDLSCNITVNKISFKAQGVTTSGTVKVGIYSEDGQTKLVDVTSAAISATGNVSISVSSVALSPGIYYIVMVPVGTTDVSIGGTYCTTCSSPSGEPVYAGNQTVASGTLPATFDPTLLTNTILVIGFRLDN